MARCRGKTRKGDQCKREATDGDRFCYLHGAEKKEKAPPQKEPSAKSEESQDSSNKDEDACFGWSPGDWIPGDWDTDSWKKEEWMNLAIGAVAGVAMLVILRAGFRFPGGR